MSYVIETKEIIYGIEHIKLVAIDNSFISYFILVNKKRILHRQDGKPAFITDQGVNDYYIKGVKCFKKEADIFGEKNLKIHLKNKLNNF